MCARAAAGHLAAIGAFCSVLFGAPLEAARLTVRLSLEGPALTSDVDAEVDVIATRSDTKGAPAGGEAERQLVVRAVAAGIATIPVAPGAWSLEVHSATHWAAPIAVEVPPEGTEVELALWPAAKIAATVRVPNGEVPPEQLELRLRRGPTARPDELAVPEGTNVTCPINRKGAMACLLPAGAWNLRLKAAGYAAAYQWAVDLPAFAERGLGTITLRRGASLSGRVVAENGPADPLEARVEVSLMASCQAASDPDRQQIGQMALGSRIDRWGYFVIYDAPAGDYVVSARQPGYAPASFEGIRVAEGLDTVIVDPLVLRQPVRLALSIEPAEELYGGEWTVRLVRLLESGQIDIAATEAAKQGSWQSPPLPPGDYLLEVMDSRDNQWSTGQLTLETDLQQHRVELDVVPVDGEVVLGDTPLAASFWFGGRTGGGVSIEGRSDDEGAFHVVLPRAGEWEVEVHSDDPTVRARALKVEVKRPAGARAARVRLELADTMVFGEVVDGRGQGAAGVPIEATSLEGQTRLASISSDGEGYFELRGQDPGLYELAAGGGRYSAIVEVALHEGFEVGPVRLVLRPAVRLEGLVQSANGPVPLAELLAFPLGAGGRLLESGSRPVSSAVDGGFVLEVPADTAAVRLVVSALGFDFHVETVPVEAGRTAPAIVTLAATDGTVRLSALHPPDPAGPQELVMIDGQPVPRGFLDRWAYSNGVPFLGVDVVDVPAMPSGNYALCEMTLPEMVQVLGGAGLPRASACREGYLPPGGHLNLDAPAGG